MKKLLLLIIATFVLVIIGCDTNTDIESPQSQESFTNQDGDTEQTQETDSPTNQNNDAEKTSTEESSTNQDGDTEQTQETDSPTNQNNDAEKTSTQESSTNQNGDTEQAQETEPATNQTGNETETNDNSAEEQENNNKDNSVIIDKENDDYYVEDDVLYINFLQKYDYSSCFYILRNNIPSSGKIVLTDKCTEIPLSIFAYLTDLKSITISGSVKNIGERAFCNCKNLETVIMEEGVESISQFAFWGCSNLTKIDFPSTLRVIGEQIFKDCDKITFDSLPEELVEIGGMAFYNCTFLGEELEIPKNVTHIGGSAFAGCSLHKVIIYDNLQDFSNAFDESGITELQIGDSVQYGYGNFGSNHFSSDTLEKVTIILNEATAIGKYMFWECSKLSDVTITKNHDEKITIGDSAFSGCSSLKEFPFEVVEKIGESSFKTCGFEELDLTAPYIGKYAFSQCHNLRRINLRDGVKEIGREAFSEICYYNSNGGFSPTDAAVSITVCLSDTIKAIEPFSFRCSGDLYISFMKDGIWSYLEYDGNLKEFTVNQLEVYVLYLDMRDVGGTVDSYKSTLYGLLPLLWDAGGGHSI